MRKRESIRGYCDGACKKDGRGGWGTVFVTYDEEKDLETTWSTCGGKKKSTNQEMELFAMYYLLKSIPKGGDVEIFCDSEYVLKGLIVNTKEGESIRLRNDKVEFTGWIKVWRQTMWRISTGDPVKHVKLWKGIERECDLHLRSGSTLKFYWVKGHSGVEGNEMADKLANEGVESISI